MASQGNFPTLGLNSASYIFCIGRWLHFSPAPPGKPSVLSCPVTSGISPFYYSSPPLKHSFPWGCSIHWILGLPSEDMVMSELTWTVRFSGRGVIFMEYGIRRQESHCWGWSNYQLLLVLKPLKMWMEIKISKGILEHKNLGYNENKNMRKKWHTGWLLAIFIWIQVLRCRMMDIWLRMVNIFQRLKRIS